ncbi:uncharacterized protein LOC128513811 [Clarias gariepinus]|uniref:uncharacterized protein LOC128513811 n=1 Tax=Clarias gariepinus TaxID=13013 RepID=UPI00234E06BB|nr:uncharacterized protein LOC128513811 [Clarias gariepinus]
MLLTPDCTPSYSSNFLMKFANDTTVVGLISNRGATKYKSEVSHLPRWWCTENNLSLKAEKMNKIFVDNRRAHTQHSPLTINGATVERDIYSTHLRRKDLSIAVTLPIHLFFFSLLPSGTMESPLQHVFLYTGVLTQDSGWGVNYTVKSICAVRGFSVSIPCNYYYPTSNPNIQVTQRIWCSNDANTKGCPGPLYVYNSSLNTTSDFEYVGDDKSNCTLLIHNVQFSYSGVYRFKFITNKTGGKWVGEPGATLQTADLKVSLIRLSGNGTLKQGDSLNLTCDVTCTHSSSQFVWSKNNEQLNPSGPVLHFPALIVRDSGNYTCTWKTKETSGSKTISLQVEDVFCSPGENPDARSVWMIVLVTAGVMFMVFSIPAVIYNRRRVHTEQLKEDDSDIYTTVQYNTFTMN